MTYYCKILSRWNDTGVDETGVDETVVDETGVYKLGCYAASPQCDVTKSVLYGSPKLNKLTQLCRWQLVNT